MAPSMKISLLALVGVAAAVPHYPAHSKFHHKSTGGYAGPTGGWAYNSTVPSATGGVPVPGDESTTETTTTSTIKSTLTQTLYVTPVPAKDASSALAAGKPSGGAGSVCGPATVTVTATNKITVTVPAGGAASPAPPKPSTNVAPEAPKPSPPAPVAPVKPSSPSSVSKEEKPTTYPAQPPVVPSKVPSVPAVSSASVQPTQPAATTPVAAPSSATSAAPSSKPSSPPTSSPGGKRGVLYRYDGAEVCKGLESKGKFGWASNWEAEPMGDIGNIEFIPTLAKLADGRASKWPAAVDTASKGAKVVFTLNEPDNDGQANMSPSDACNAWKDNIAPLVEKYSGVKFVGPSVSSSADKGKGLDWLKTFMSTCPQAKFQAANFHWYGTPADGFDAFKAHIEQAHADTGMDFYVTEFAVNKASAEDSASFLEKAQAYLDGHPNCLGYSYFAAGTFDPGYGMTAANLLGTSDNLTPAGKVYIS